FSSSFSSSSPLFSFFSSTLIHQLRFLKGEGREVEVVGFIVLCILHFSPYIINIYD
ncbi:hypothetical protein GW17_00004110, partial [Ensete ventricosum]